MLLHAIIGPVCTGNRFARHAVKVHKQYPQEWRAFNPWFFNNLSSCGKWDAFNGGHAFTYRGHSTFVQAVAWSPDGKRIASGSWDKTVQVRVAG